MGSSCYFNLEGNRVTFGMRVGPKERPNAKAEKIRKINALMARLKKDIEATPKEARP